MIMLTKGFINSLSVFLFFIVVFFLTRQMPLAQYSYIMNIALFLFFVLNFYFFFREIKSNVILMYIFYVVFLFFWIGAVYSVFFRGNDIWLVIRFSVIINLILLAYLCFPRESYIRIFLWVVGAQAVFIILFEFYMIKYYSIENYGDLRDTVRSMGWGDVYTYNGVFWRIQLKGNALLPFAFFVSWIYLSSFKRYLISSLFLVALILAGNFAFILGVIVFFVIYYFVICLKSVNRFLNYIVFCFFSILFLGFPAISYVSSVIETKSEHSNPTRIDQTDVLLGDLSENPFLGRGLGNTINVVTEYRDYTDNIYFELQAFYFLNQMGVFYFIFFILLNVILCIHFIKYSPLFAAYLGYVFYAFFNPYFLDTTHIIVILVLISLRRFFDEKSLYGFSDLQCRYRRS